MRAQPRPPSVASHDGRGVDSMLAAIATLTAAWPLSNVLAEPTWVRGTILLLAVIALSGVGARSLALRGWQVLVVQLVALVLAASTIYGRGQLWHGLPTFQTLGFADRLVHEAIATAQRVAAPAPTTPGLIFLVGGSLGLAALAVDYLAVTRRSPALAGLPLLTVFLAAVANQGSTMPVIFFLAATVMWLILLARAGNRILRRWGSTMAMGHTPERQSPRSQGTAEHASTARTLGAMALFAAMAVPIVLPQLPPTFLRSGLGRSSSAGDNGSAAVGFEQSLDLADDLKDPSRAPVLQYTTADTSPPPLRVAVGSFYRSEPGVWLPFGRPWVTLAGNADLSANPRIPEPTGLSPEVPRRIFAMEVRRNRLEDPVLAAPYPLTGVDLAGINWGADVETQSLRVAERPEAYTISYLHLDPTTTMLRDAPALTESNRSRFDLDLNRDGPFVERVAALTTAVTADKATDFDKAMAIQEYLRTSGGFTYSLTLAPPARDPSGGGAPLDSLSNFLVTKRGYCVQFATAMVMMAREAGIPARMALGFLPGTAAKGVWNVVAADAHAWPELYFEGIGWTRFEPTPSREAPPRYAIPATSPVTGPGGQPTSTPKAQVPTGAPLKDLGDPTTDAAAAAQVGLTPAAVARWLTHGWGAVLLASLIGLLGSLVVPVAARWRRRRRLSTARTSAARTEVEWELLTSSLGDLGIAPEPSRTPRQLRRYYDRQALLEGAASQALGRVVQTLERSRYAPAPPDQDGRAGDDDHRADSSSAAADLSADARKVIRAAAATRDRRYRIRAVLWPSSGLSQLRSTGAEVAWRIRAPLRDLSKLFHRR